MDLLQLLVWIFASGYTVLMACYAYGWKLLEEVKVAEGALPTTFFTILVPCKNEADQIEDCLNAIKHIDYPSSFLEVLLIDDGSEDATVFVASEWIKREKPGFSISIIQNLGIKGKKYALTLGVSRAAGSHIACTDADCKVPVQWLKLLDNAYRQHPAIQAITGPVLFHEEKGLLQWFQSLDLIGLMGITGAGIRLGWQHMANGANLSYPKSAFSAVEGYKDNFNIPSGDDFFLIQKLASKWPKSILFLKNPEAAVLTRAMPTWRSFFFQRLRWGSKNAALPEWPVRLSLAWVFLFCWLLLSTLNPVSWAIKTAVDLAFLYSMAQYWQKPKAILWFLPAQILHVLYITVMGTSSLFFKKYPWK